MMVAASAERYVLVSHWTNRQFTVIERCSVIVLVMAAAFVLKGTVFLELQVQQTNCTNVSTHGIELTQSSLAQSNEVYKVWWMFYCRHLFSMLLPFPLLVFLNGTVVSSLRRHLAFRGAMMRVILSKKNVEERQSEIRAATRMLVATATAFLIANSANFLLTVWEQVDKDALRGILDGLFYAIASDVVSDDLATC